MKFLYIIGIGFVMPLISRGQDIAAYTEKGVAVVEHTIEKGQGLQAIATQYKANYSEVLKINQLSSSSVLKEGSKIKIPIGNILQTNCDGANCVKVYHTVQQSEGLYRIGVNYGNQKVPQLKKMNNLTTDAVSMGQKILVGYLPAGWQNIKTEVIEQPVAEVTIKVPEVAKVAEPKVESKVEPVVPAAPVQTKSKVVTIVDLTKPAVAETPMAGQVKKEPVAEPASKPMSESQSVVTNTPVPAPLKIEAPKTSTTASAGGEYLSSSKKGFFSSQFATPTTEVAGKAAYFKSESGWSDGKYYILMDGVKPGSIVMVTIPSTPGNSIYAKVLGSLPQVKENDGIKFRLNEAGANVLGVSQLESFQVVILY
jgi:LysM repeat protein